MYPKKDNTLSLLGGAVVGALAMYLLDPDSGERRRRRIAESTGEAAARAGDTLAPVWDRVSDTARAVGTSLAAGAGTLGHEIAEKYAEARDSRTANRISDRASDITSRVTEKLRDAASAPRHWFEREEPSHAGTYTGLGLGSLVLGAGLMYLFDPVRGRARRAVAMDKAASIVRRTGHTACQIGKDVRNRAAGYAHEARGLVSHEEPVTAEQLLQRVRSEMGHVVTHAGAIQVMTDNQGRVTLHGKVLASEADRLISTIKGVSGVNEVINLLSVKETEQQMHETDVAATCPPGQQVPQL